MIATSNKPDNVSHALNSYTTKGTNHHIHQIIGIGRIISSVNSGRIYKRQNGRKCELMIPQQRRKLRRKTGNGNHWRRSIRNRIVHQWCRTRNKSRAPTSRRHSILKSPTKSCSAWNRIRNGDRVWAPRHSSRSYRKYRISSNNRGNRIQSGSSHKWSMIMISRQYTRNWIRSRKSKLGASWRKCGGSVSGINPAEQWKQCGNSTLRATQRGSGDKTKPSVRRTRNGSRITLDHRNNERKQICGIKNLRHIKNI